MDRALDKKANQEQLRQGISVAVPKWQMSCCRYP